MIVQFVRDEFHDARLGIAVAGGVFGTLFFASIFVLPADAVFSLFGMESLADLDDGGPTTAVSIFLNNVSIAITLVVGGATLGVFTAGLLVSNALVLGAAIQLIARNYGADIVLAGIVVHGVIELPAIVLAAGTGFEIGRKLFSTIWNWECAFSKRDVLDYSSQLGIVVTMLGIAAVLETMVSTWLLTLVVS